MWIGAVAPGGDNRRMIGFQSSLRELVHYPMLNITFTERPCRKIGTDSLPNLFNNSIEVSGGGLMAPYHARAEQAFNPLDEPGGGDKSDPRTLEVQRHTVVKVRDDGKLR